jgi:membrane-associated phospholipid phosphatase
MSRLSRAGLLAVLALAACTDAVPLPTLPATDAARANRAAPRDRETASVRWSALTRAISVRRGANPLIASRLFALVSVAMYDADIAALDAKARGQHPSEAAAVASASATVLRGLYPVEGAAIDAQLLADGQYFPSIPSERDADWALGVPVGNAVGLAVLAHAASDGVGAVWGGTLPVGPGFWYPAPGVPPIAPQWGGIRPWFLTSNDQFRPAPPPAFGSAAYLTDLAEVRAISDTRTAQQLEIAQYWASGPGAIVAHFANGIAADLVTGEHLDERKAARVFALTHAALMDASIACWEAKYTYTFIRPSQADPAITTPVGLPNHPSYPSGHSCLTSAAMGVLSTLFPSEAGSLDAYIVEAGEARIYGGIHYRFDVLAGRKLGLGVAAFVLQSAHDAHAPIPVN